jgi:hypothetical protein
LSEEQAASVGGGNGHGVGFARAAGLPHNSDIAPTLFYCTGAPARDNGLLPSYTRRAPGESENYTGLLSQSHPDNPECVRGECGAVRRLGAAGPVTGSVTRPGRLVDWAVFLKGDAPMYRTLSLVLVVMALVCFAAAPALAEKAAEGTFVKIEGKTLTIKDKDNKEHSCELAPDAKVSCDGKECKLSDLKAGFKVKVTIADKKATKIEASTK